MFHTSLFIGTSIAERLNIQCVQCAFAPYEPTAYLPYLFDPSGKFDMNQSKLVNYVSQVKRERKQERETEKERVQPTEQTESRRERMDAEGLRWRENFERTEGEGTRERTQREAREDRSTTDRSPAPETEREREKEKKGKKEKE